MLRATFSINERTCCIAADWPERRRKAGAIDSPPATAAGIASRVRSGGNGRDVSRAGARGAALGEPRSLGRLAGTTVGADCGARPSAEATTARN